MDNASKALIMAGAILISIAIVGVGVFIFSSTSSITNSGQQQLDAAAAQTANSTLRQYAGTRQRGSTVKEFVEYCATLNANKTFPNDITVYSGDTATTNILGNETTKNSYLNGITANAYYTVKLSDNLPTSSHDGYYDKVVITAN